jgi:uncharacterized RDD family membrane protein YckC
MLISVSTTAPRRSQRYTPPKRALGRAAGVVPARDRVGRPGGGRGRDAPGASGEPDGRDPRVAQDAHDTPGGPGAAPAGRRIVAALVDAAVVPVAVLTAAEVAWRTGVLRAVGVTPAGWARWSYSFPRVAWTVAALAVAYHGLCTVLWGRTVGKRLTGLAIVTSDGGRVRLPRALWRAAWSATIYVPAVVAPIVLTSGWLAVIGRRRQSLPDRAAGTRVIRLHNGEDR